MSILIRRIETLEKQAVSSTSPARLRNMILDRPLDVGPNETLAEAWARQYPGEPVGLSPPTSEDEWPGHDR